MGTTSWRWPWRIVQVVLGLGIGLGITEIGFNHRDHGAFPHLNLYVADAALGVRLRPGGTEKISFSGNPVTSVRINQDGYRGTDFPAVGTDEILVVGDSQVFGLGVEENETFAAELGKTTQRTVINGGVPTYGPSEYNGVLKELIERRHPKVVIYTVNMANDLFEASRPNTQRHTVWDGWAVRKETAPPEIPAFPGRNLLYRESHAMFALRRFWHKTAPRLEGPATDWGRTVSEGDWHDIVGASAAAKQRHVEQQQQMVQAAAERGKSIVEADAELTKIEQKLEGLVTIGEERGLPGNLRAARATPGDIIQVEYGEGSSPVPMTAQHIVDAAKIRKELEKALEATPNKPTADANKPAADANQPSPDSLSDVSVTPENLNAARETLRSWDETAQRLTALKQKRLTVLRAHSPLSADLARAKQLCDAAGARLIVLILPIDVQVSADEWKKYHAEPLDMRESRVLTDDIVASVESMGATAVDAWPPLAAAEPGAFLDGDIHMTAKGHRAVATALAAALTAKPLVPPPGELVLPPGRTAVPTFNEWWDNQSKEANELAPGCRIRRIREWLRMSCRTRSKLQTVGLHVAKAGRAEPLLLVRPDLIVATLGVVKDDAVAIDFIWKTKTIQMSISWPASEAKPKFTYAPVPTPAVESLSAASDILCSCREELSISSDAVCSELGGIDADCMTSYAGDCERLLACAAANPKVLPHCKAGFVNGGATGRCVAR